MSLSKAIRAELRQLGSDPTAIAALSTTTDGVHSLCCAASERGSAVQIDFVDVDRYSLNLRQLRVQAANGSEESRPGDPTLETDSQLNLLAQRIIDQLEYLEEPLALIERDIAEARAQLRSAPPQRDENTISYWEVVLQLGAQPSASIARYQWEPGMPEREPQPYPAAFALVGRIAESLTNALNTAEE